MIRRVELSVRGSALIQQSHPAEVVDGGFHQPHHALRFGFGSLLRDNRGQVSDRSSPIAIPQLPEWPQSDRKTLMG